ncbi:hypothetical protein AVEN_18285-1 [Araneus ventricosus]|uniref:Endonuclease/exonuclease/phosphatase domain-containing protein n=1 Tax=Araneus ventricosus TaxID=182803 RepID=A0A4Y2AJ58_ARAVE|nr:hypothetical protein AVEN_18285-1 [Araneus ventricosus]
MSGNYSESSDAEAHNLKSAGDTHINNAAPQMSCKYSNNYCTHCGHEHQTRHCRSSFDTCTNCYEENTQKGTTYNIDHSATDNKCPMHLQEIARSLRPISLTVKENIIAIKVTLKERLCTIISAYSSPSIGIEPDLTDLQNFTQGLRGEDFIIGADLNAHHTSWGHNDTNPRGRAIEDFLQSSSTSQILPSKWSRGGLIWSLAEDPQDSNSTSDDIRFNNDIPFLKTEIRNILNALLKGKAPGYDDIDNIIFLLSSPELILYLVNRCLELGLFPTCFKIGVMLLFYEKGVEKVALYNRDGETLAHEAAAWSRNLAQRHEKKLSSIQKLFLLNITGAYRTTSTAALQVIAGFMPLHLKIKLESEYVRIAWLRQNIVGGGRTLQPCNYEDKVHGWHNRPAECIKEGRISLEKDIENKGLINFFTDASRSELCVGTAFCILDEQQELHHSWQGRLQEKNSVC